MKINEEFLGYVFGFLCFMIAIGLFIHLVFGTTDKVDSIVLFIFMGVVGVLMAKAVAHLKNANIYLREQSNVLKTIREKIK